MITNIIIGVVLWFARAEMNEWIFNVLWWLNILSAACWTVGEIATLIAYYKD